MKASAETTSLDWYDAPLPSPPHNLPGWLLGLRVEWHDDYENSPVFCFVTDGVPAWPNKIWHKDGGLYTAYHDDGRADMLHHDGKLEYSDVVRFITEDGLYHSVKPREPHVTMKMRELASTPQAGFGGEQFRLNLEDGRMVVLRGPWDVGSPPECQLVYLVGPGGQPHGTMKVKSRLVLSAAAAFPSPDLKVAVISRGGSFTLVEPYKAEWEMPKGIRQHLIYRARDLVAPGWRASTYDNFHLPDGILK